MLNIEYSLEENDYLEFQLFVASTSPMIVKKKRRSWILLSVVSTALTINFIVSRGDFLAVYFGLISLAIILFYPKYINWKYKRHYLKHISENYANRFGELEYIEFHDDHLYAKDKVGEGTINLSEVEFVDELKDYFFLRLSTGVSMIIPKYKIDNQDEVRNEFVRLGIEINDNLDWVSK